MAHLKDVAVSVTGPDEIEVSLVREDYLRVSDGYRMWFEVFVALCATSLGAVLNVDSPTLYHWAALFGFGAIAGGFLWNSISYRRDARAQTKRGASKVAASPYIHGGTYSLYSSPRPGQSAVDILRTMTGAQKDEDEED